MNKESLAEKWREYTIIKSINFVSDLESDSNECSVHLDLCMSEYAPEDSIKIAFYGVSNFKVGEIGGGLSQLCRLDVADIRDKQWDRLNYYVFDYENDAISFNCRDLDIVSE